MNDFFTSFGTNHSNPWLQAAFESGIVIVVALLLFVFGNAIISKLFRRLIVVFHSPVENELITPLNRLYKKLVILVATNLILTTLPLENKALVWAHNAIFIVIAFYVMIGAFEISNICGSFVRAKAPEFEGLFTRVMKILIALVTLMVAMRHFNYDIWHIMTALGVGTLAVGLAAQPTLTNMIAGFTILIDRPFRPGERIALSGGEVGDVIQIGMRSTRIYTTDGNMLIVSNSELVNSKVINFSLPTQGYGQKIKFNVDHSVPANEIKDFVGTSVSKIEGVSRDSVKVYATNMTDWGLEMSVFYKVEHFALTSNVADKIIDTMVIEFRRRNIRFSTLPLHVIPV